MDMPKTLDGMTPEEWPQCVGMWCEHHGRVAVIAGFSRDSHIPDEWPEQWDVEVVEPGQFSQREGSPSGYIPVSADITLRFDLPRAWNPDGTPMTGEQETLITQPHPRGSWNSDPEYPEYFQVPPGTTMRRWVSDWEPVEPYKPPSPTPLDELTFLSPPTVEEENAIRQKYGLPLKPDPA